MSSKLNITKEVVKRAEKILANKEKPSDKEKSDAILQGYHNLRCDSHLDKNIIKVYFDNIFKHNTNKPDVENVFIASGTLPDELITDDVTRFAKVTLEMTKLYAKKNHDYGNAFEKGIKDIGLKYAVSRLYDKVNRFITFTNNNELLVKDEKIEDTLIDLANYSIMTIIAMRKSR